MLAVMREESPHALIVEICPFHAERPLDQCTGAMADQPLHFARRERREPEASPHVVGAAYEVEPRVDERTVEVEKHDFESRSSAYLASPALVARPFRWSVRPQPTSRPTRAGHNEPNAPTTRA